MWSSTKIPNPDGLISTAWCSFSQQPKSAELFLRDSKTRPVPVRGLPCHGGCALHYLVVARLDWLLLYLSVVGLGRCARSLDGIHPNGVDRSPTGSRWVIC